MSHRRRRTRERRLLHRKVQRAEQDQAASRRALGTLLDFARRSGHADLFALALCLDEAHHVPDPRATIWPHEHALGLRGLDSVRRLIDRIERKAALVAFGRSDPEP